MKQREVAPGAVGLPQSGAGINLDLKEACLKMKRRFGGLSQPRFRIMEYRESGIQCRGTVFSLAFATALTSFDGARYATVSWGMVGWLGTDGKRNGR